MKKKGDKEKENENDVKKILNSFKYYENKAEK